MSVRILADVYVNDVSITVYSVCNTSLLEDFRIVIQSTSSNISSTTSLVKVTSSSPVNICDNSN